MTVNRPDTNFNMTYKDYIDTYFNEFKEITDKIDRASIEKFIEILKELKERRGRLFILGIGGSAVNASHAVNDFRKICGIEAYTPADNIGELTARTNDDGFEYIFSDWLKVSRLDKNDILLIFSVGGGSEHTSKNLVLAMEYAKEVGTQILGIVSRDGGMTKKLADISILIPVVNNKSITPHAEEWQGIIWHLIVNAFK